MEQEKKINQEQQQNEISKKEAGQERVTSQKVVSEKVLGSSGGLARFGRKVKKQISGRLSGILLGLLLIVISFFVVWQSEKFEKSADLVAGLPVLTVEQAADTTGLVKVAGKVTEEPIQAPIEKKDVLYYHHVREELETVSKTETDTQVVTRDGQDIEQTIEKEVEKDQWVTKVDESQWAEIVLDNKIVVKPQFAKQVLDLTEIYSMESEETRQKIEAVLPSDSLIVVGELYNNRIEGGEPFIVSNKSNQALIDSLKSSENFIWWLLKLGTVLLFGFGLYLLLGPFLLVLDAIPVLGKIGKGGLLIICLIIGLIFTVLSSLVIAFWYIILILLVALIVYLIYLKNKKNN
ncbi:MAG: hypothetical protein GF365_02310 [Candidatus Buchananbacteria bacterium]|nr:hypothetical protein [Candidatus Buchananbacteria bacterium]